MNRDKEVRPAKEATADGIVNYWDRYDDWTNTQPTSDEIIEHSRYRLSSRTVKKGMKDILEELEQENREISYEDLEMDHGVKNRWETKPLLENYEEELRDLA